MKIYTKTGDNGETSFIGGRISKAADMIDLVGELDEVNAALGVTVAELNNFKTKKLQEIVSEISGRQRDLFSLGALVANPGLDSGKSSSETKRVYEWVASLEDQIDVWELRLPPLQNFILPGGDKCGANLHLSRAVCRRAERAAVRLIQGLSNQPDSQSSYPTTLRAVQRYLNRLSDYLFVLARYTNQLRKAEEKIWSQDTKQMRMEF